MTYAFRLAACIATSIACSAIAFAQTGPTPAPTPAATSSPSPTPIPAVGSVTWSLDASNTFVDQGTAGSGTQPPEGPGFAIGSPLSPMTPYDVWSSAPQTPGLAGVLQYTSTATYHGARIAASAMLGLGLVTGSVTNATYWGENLLPTYNPHLGSQALPYAIVFPANNHGDDGSALRFSMLGASAGAPDGSWNLRGGYFDLAQTVRFVFIQPPLPNVTPALGVAPAESLQNSAPTLQWWPAAEQGLPLFGLDFTAHRGLASFELSNAALPALPSTHVQMTSGSLIIDHGEGTRYAAQVLHVTTSGALISTTTMFGANAVTIPGPQGMLPISTLGSQQESIAGISASFHISKIVEATKTTDSLIEIGRAWYNAENVIEPGTQKPGGYYHIAVIRKIHRATATLEGFRFEARYATAILPYGIPENIWSVAWSWPGQWLKSTYQLVDNTALGANRQGFRIKYFVDGGPLEWHVQYATYQQIDSATLANVNQTGFVDGFFLPQLNGFGTIGDQHQYAAWLAWHPAFGTITVDYVNDTQHRGATAAHPEDYVDYSTPQTVLMYSRQISAATTLAAGYGRYAMKGMWALTPIDYGQNIAFLGAEFQQSKTTGLFVQLRHSSFDGLPSMAGGPPPNFAANLILLEERIHL